MAEEATEGEEPKKKKPVLLIIIAVNVLLGGGAAGFFFLRSAPAPAPAAAGEGGHAEEAAAEADAGPRTARPTGPMVPFEAMIVNLNEPEGTRFLKIALTVQIVNDKLTQPVNDAKPIIRDHFIRELSDLNYRQTSGNKNKLSIKRRLIKRFNEAMGTDAATDIHITEFIVQ